MCGSYTLREKEGLQKRFSTQNSLDFELKQISFPGQPHPIIRISPEGKRTLELVHWGITPVWAKEGARPLINARHETIAEKPTFKEAFRKGRILVPADGFFEWSGEGKDKQKHYFEDEDHGVFSMAGLITSFKLPSGETREGYVILTTKPDGRVAPFHDRMPVILRGEEEGSWLEGVDII